jgi:hypothetical protein
VQRQQAQQDHHHRRNDANVQAGNDDGMVGAGAPVVIGPDTL